ncbi:MAG: hypothetical protein ACRELV_00595 [Longimicrobiales bacterium]
MKRLTTLCSLLTLLGLWQSGCVELPFEATSDGELAEQDRADLAWALADLVYAGSNPADGAALARYAEGEGEAAPAEEPEARPFAITHACPEGGVLRLGGEAVTIEKPDLGTTVTEFGAQANPDDCGVVVRGQDVALDGDPSIHVDGRLERNEQGLVGEQRVGLEGAFIWTSGDRAGSCDIALTARWNATTGARSLSGVFCGTELHVEASPV